jgi:hypothetical protein
MAAMAHELGHAKGGVIQRATDVGTRTMFGQAKYTVPDKKYIPKFLKGKQLVTPVLSPLHVPLAIAAASPIKEDDNKVVKFIKKNPAAIAAGMTAVPLLGEAHASARALKYIKKMPKKAGGGWKGVRREALPLAKSFGTHALAYAPAVAGLYAISKLRDFIQKRREQKKLEKTAEYAPGIPNKEKMRAIPTSAKPRAWTFVEQSHDAKRAGRHSDIRLSDGRTAFSWASRKGIPEPGQKVMVIRQPDHTPAYMKFKGRITSDYGKGRVRISREGLAKIRKSGKNRISFALLDKQNPQELSLIRTPKYGKNRWLMINRTPTTKTRPDVPTGKPKFREAKAAELGNYLTKRYALESKLDGAHVTVNLGDRAEVFSHRAGKDGALLNHSYVVGADEITPPKSLKDTVVRAEVIGVKKNKAIPLRELGGIMNTSPQKALERMKRTKTQLWVAPFQVERYRGKDMRAAPYREHLKVLKEVGAKLPGNWGMPDVALSRSAKKRLIKRIQDRRHKMTQEGLVAWPMDEAAGAPTKIKFKGHHQVYIDEIFPMQRAGKDTELAGGFTYRLKPGGPVVGRVGTGFSMALRKEMWDNKKQLKGRKAVLSSTEQFPNGAYRAPSFISFHL